MNRKDCTFLSAAISIAALSASPALAQVSPLIIDRNRIDRQEGMAPAPQTAPDTLRGRSSIDDTVDALGGAKLQRVNLRGSSLPPEDAAGAWRNQIGAPLDRKAIEAISENLSKIYKKSDVALFTILTPGQDLSDGALDLVVVEGHINNVVIQTKNAKAKDLPLIRAYAANLTRERPLRRATLERYLSLIRDIPGETMDAQLVPAKDRGGATLILSPKLKRFETGFGINNRGTELLGRTQASLDFTYNGALRAGDQTTLSAAMPTGNDLFTYTALSHSSPIGSNGVRVNFSASKLKTRLKSGIDGDAETAGMSVSYPIIRGYQSNMSASLGLDSLDSSNAAFGRSLDSSVTRVVRANISYGASSQTSSLGASASISKGTDFWSARVDPLSAQSDFTKLSAQAGYDKVFAKHYVLRLRAAGQASGDLLPASEQMTLGGQAFGRAYEGAVLQGDQAIAGSIEAGYRFSKLLPEWMSGTEVYAFTDAGKVWLNRRPLWTQSYDFSLSSAGLGTRLALGKKTTIGLEFAQGLETPYPGVEDEWRFSYSLVSRH